MSLPHQNLDAVPFTPLTAEFLDNMNENIESLARGTGLDNKSVKPEKIDLASMFAGKNHNHIVTIGKLTIQFGWTQFLGNSTKLMQTPITFPKAFTEVHAIMAGFNGYKDSVAGNRLPEFITPVGAGNHVEASKITNTGCVLVATSVNNFGYAQHAVSWIAIGEA